MARTGDIGTSSLVHEAAMALGAVSHDPAELVLACRQLIEHRPSSGPLVWLAARMLEASMTKAYVCRAAEWVTREAMQIHGGMGYAEEYPVSRYFVDARVLSIFEGADETLALKVIIRRLLAQRTQ